MTATINEVSEAVEVVEPEGLDPLCDNPAHPKGRVPRASYAVWMYNPQPCGHELSDGPLHYLCAGCFTLWRTVGAYCQGRMYAFEACVYDWRAL